MRVTASVSLLTWRAALQIMMKLKSAKNLDARQTMLLEHAYFQVRLIAGTSMTVDGCHAAYIMAPASVSLQMHWHIIATLTPPCAGSATGAYGAA
jgi:hypothetical protein